MRREFKLGRLSFLLDFDNKADNAPLSGTDLIHKLNMDHYSAPSRRPLQVLGLFFLRGRATEGPNHLEDHPHIPGRQMQHGRQVQ